MASPAPATARSWDALAVAVGLWITGSHLRFFAIDERVPRDPGLYYGDVPQAWAWLGDPGAHVGELLELLGTSGGWYQLVLAAALRVFGRSSEVFDGVVAIWVPLVVLMVGLLARRLGGSAAAAFAVALVGTVPWVVVTGRTPWIHLPETALVLGALAAWAYDPDLERPRTVAAMIVTGGLALALRPSGLVFVAPLVLVLRPWARPRSWWILGGWSLAVAPAVEHVLSGYMDAKLAAREGYEQVLPPWWAQLLDGLGPPTLAILLLGLLAVLVKRRFSGGLGLVVACWVASSALMWAIFSVGFDNFVVLGPGLVVVAAVALVAVHPRLALLPTLVLAGTRAMGGLPEPSPNDWKAPWSGFSARHVLGLFDASCPESGGCVVAADRGLFASFGEDVGELGIFLLARDEVQVQDLRFRANLPEMALDAAATYECPMMEQDWTVRHPHAARNLAQVAVADELLVVWKHEVTPGCTFVWMTPSGELPRPELLPADGETVEEPYEPAVVREARPRAPSRGRNRPRHGAGRRP